MSRTSTYLLLVFTMMMWGSNVIAIKLLIEYFPPILMQGLRILLAGITLCLFVWWKKHIQILGKKEWLTTAAAGFFGITVHHLFLAIGLGQTTASNAGIILALIPLTTSILAILFLQVRLTKLRLTGIFSGLGGVLIVVFNTNGQFGKISSGDFFILTAMLSQAVSFILIKKNSRTVNPKLMTAIMLTMGALFLFVFSFFMDTKSITNMAVPKIHVWTLLFLSAVVATGMGQLLYNVAIQKIGPGQTSIFNNFMPFFTLLGSVLFLKETIYLEHLMGLLLIIIGVVLGTGYIDERLTNKRRNKLGGNLNI